MVSIIILSYNTASLISECLSSVKKFVKDIPYEVIVVDNNSFDQSVHLIKTKFPSVRVIESEENLGFAKGVNLGAKQAKGDLLLFLNSDATFTGDDLKKLMTCLDAHEDAAVVGGRLKNKHGFTSSSYSNFYTISEVIRFLFSTQKTSSHQSRPLKVDWVSGGFMLIRKEIFTQLHGFDERYFMYIEDMDLCYRLSKKGFSVYYNPQAVVSHVGQGSSNRTFAIVQIYKGLLYFYKKHKPGWQYWLVRLLLITKAMVSLIVGVITHNVYLKNTYSSALKHAL